MTKLPKIERPATYAGVLSKDTIAARDRAIVEGVRDRLCAIVGSYAEGEGAEAFKLVTAIEAYIHGLTTDSLLAKLYK